MIVLCRLTRYIACSLTLSVIQYFYYTTFHVERMDPYPIKLDGRQAYQACLLLAFPLSMSSVGGNAEEQRLHCRLDRNWYFWSRPLRTLNNDVINARRTSESWRLII